MSRYMLLEKEINKGIKIDERSGQVIPNWSPNNVRRLILGATHAIVQYYVTGVKYRKLTEIVFYGRELQKDMEQFIANPKGYSGLLKVLVAGRICSSVEEIFVCTPNYPDELMGADLNIARLAGGGDGNINAKLANRFVRLNHISKINIPIEKLESFINSAKASDTLLLDVFKEKGVPVQPIYIVHKEDWWKGTYLRGKLYTMDAEGEILDRYFTKLIDKRNEEIKQKKLADIELAQIKDRIEKNIGVVNNICSKILTNFDIANEIFNKTSIIDKLEWSSLLSTQNMSKGIKNQFFKPNPFSNNYNSPAREVDTPNLLNSLTSLSHDPKPISSLMDVIFTNIIPDSKPYADNKLDVESSFLTIKQLSRGIFKAQTSIIYASLVKYLLKTGLKHADYHANKLSSGVLPSLVYARDTIMRINFLLNLSNNEASEALKIAGAKEVLHEDFKLATEIEMCNKIIQELTRLSTR